MLFKGKIQGSPNETRNLFSKSAHVLQLLQNITKSFVLVSKFWTIIQDTGQQKLSSLICLFPESRKTKKKKQNVAGTQK